MHRDAIERLLPTVYQLAARPGSPLDAALQVMADLHEPDEALLLAIEEIFDPYRAPPAFVPWLTRWVGLDWLVADEPDDVEGAGAAGVRPGAFAPGLGRLRDVVAIGHALAQWRGTDVGLKMFLTAATGLSGFAVDEPADRPFHLVVTAPAATAPYAPVLRRIVEHMKPASTTAEIEFAQEPDPATGSTKPDPATDSTKPDPATGNEEGTGR